MAVWCVPLPFADCDLVVGQECETSVGTISHVMYPSRKQWETNLSSAIGSGYARAQAHTRSCTHTRACMHTHVRTCMHARTHAQV